MAVPDYLYPNVWRRKIVEGVDIDWPCVSLGWDPNRYQVAQAAGQANWFELFAQEARFDICAPWLTYEGGQAAYAELLFPSSGSNPSPCLSLPHVAPPLLTGISLAPFRVLDDLIRPAGALFDASMLRPLGTFVDGQPHAPVPAAPLIMPALFIGAPPPASTDADRLTAFWRGNDRWGSELAYQSILKLGPVRIANELHRVAAETAAPEGGQIMACQRQRGTLECSSWDTRLVRYALARW